MTGIHAACQSVEPEDEEEVGPTPSPGYSDGRAPVWREGRRTGGGKILTQESKHHFLPLSIDSQVCMYGS